MPVAWSLPLTLPLPFRNRAKAPLDSRAGVAVLTGLALAPLLGLWVASSPTVAGGATAGIAVAAILMGRAHWAAYATLFGMFFTNVGLPLGFAYLDLGDLSSMALLPIWLLSRLAGNRRPRLIPSWWIIPVYVLWMYVTYAVGGAPTEVFGRFLRQIQIAMTCLAVMDLLAEEKRVETAFWLMAIAGTIHALLAVPQFGSAYRVGGVYDQPNYFAHSLSMAAIPALALWQSTARSWVKSLLAGMVGLMVLGVILSISRGTYLALGLTLIWWVRRNRRQLFAGLALAAIFGAMVPQIRERESSDIAARMAMHDLSVTNRWVTVLNGLNAVEAHPIFGVGFGQYTQLDRSVEVTQQAGRSAHNFYLSIAAASGIPALLIYLSFVGALSRSIWRWQGKRAELTGSNLPTGRAIMVQGAQGMLIYMGFTLLTKGGGGAALWCTLGLCGAVAQLPVRGDDETVPPPAPPEPPPTETLPEPTA